MTRPKQRFCVRLGVLLLVIISTSSCAQTRGTRTAATKYSSEFGGVYHVVEKGQTLWRISRAYNVDLETVQWVNNIEDVTSIPVGKRLFIPGVDTVLHVEPYRPGESVPAKTTVVKVAWPLSAHPSSGFGPRSGREHEGLDLPAPKGTSIRAAANGRVVYSGQGMKGYGKVVVLKHSDDLSTVYAHNSANLVRMGDRVKKGQVIARVGQTGWATGPHLHFEVRKRGVPEDPLVYLPET
jgi:hypothetical protein